MKKKFLANAGILLGAAIVLTWILEYRCFLNDTSATWNFVMQKTMMFFVNVWIMWLILAIVVAITKRVWVGVGIVGIMVLIIGFIDAKKMMLRGTPLLPEDFQLAGQVGEVTSFVDGSSIAKLFITIGFMIALVIVLSVVDDRKIEFGKREILSRIATVVVAVVLFMFSTDFIRNHDGGRYENIKILNTTFTAWNQTRNYDENGFIVGFLYNLSKLKLSEPEGYSEERIAEIKTKYQKEKQEDEKNNERESLKNADYNIVIVLNESFFDPEIIKSYYPYSGGDVTPNLHRIMNDHSSGYMYTLDYGGGTANIEFETLTGMTNYWVNTVPYTNLIPKISAINSIASLAKENNYKTTAVHPYNGGMYKRNISLKKEGFDTFITELEMNYREHEGDSEYINDQSAYKQVVDVLKGDEQKQLVALITMQNHTPYKNTTYTTHDFELSVFTEPENAERKSAIETYLQTLHESDKYLGEFIDELERLDEKTVVLFFGDHSAGLFDELNDSDDASEAFTLSRTTPYFIYSNFEMQKSKLPKTSPNCLTNTLLNKLNVRKTEFYYLLDEVCLAEPILASTYFSGKTLEKTKLLNDYELVTYDALGGKNYWNN